jgi:hypothetical protein
MAECPGRSLLPVPRPKATGGPTQRGRLRLHTPGGLRFSSPPTQNDVGAATTPLRQAHAFREVAQMLAQPGREIRLV